MKRIFLSIFFLSVVAVGSAQDDKFQKAMEQTITTLDSAKTTEDLNDVGAKFERMAAAEKTQWLPYYYAAFSNILIGLQDDKADKDKIADKADELISKAISLAPKSSEVYLLKSMAATVHMMVDPMNRWQKYGADSREALMTARQLDQNNPRTYYWEGMTTMNTPEQFGGGKAKAKAIFEQSLALFKSFRPVSNIDPKWGESITKQMYEACKSE